MLNFSRRHYLFLLFLILAFATVTRIYRLAEPKEYIFDEVYHAVTSKLIRRNDVRAYEWWNPPVEINTAVDWLHPPLAKYTQALGMQFFGENSFGWRISSAVFGVLIIAATAKLADQLFQSKKIALFAAAVASLDGLLLVQSRIAMNDVHVTFFILLTLICYLRFRQPVKVKDAELRWDWLFLTGLSAGFAMGSKWSGIFVLFAIGMSELILHFYQRIQQKKTEPISLSHGFLYLLFLFILPTTIYVLSYSHMFLEGKTLICEGNKVEQGKCYCRQESSWWVEGLKKYGPSSEWSWKIAAGIPVLFYHLPNQKVLASGNHLPNFWENLEARGGCKRLVSHFSELHNQIWWYQTHLTATHPFQSRPFDWFLNLRPVWFYNNSNADTSINIYNFGNPLLFWFGDVAVVVTLSYFIVRYLEQFLLHKLKFSRVDGSLFLLLFTYFIVWLPWQLSPRIMFFYHYTPAVPLLSIIFAYWLVKLGHHHKTTPYLLLGVIFLSFVIWYPQWTGLAVPKEFADRIYFAIPSWK